MNLLVGNAEKPLLHREINFLKARTGEGRSNRAGVVNGTKIVGFEDYQVHVVRCKANETRGDQDVEMKEGDHQDSETTDPAFEKFLPKGAVLFPGPKDGQYDRLSKWQKIKPVGVGCRNLGNTCFINSVLQCLTYLPGLAQLCLAEESEPANLKRIAALAKENGDENRFCALNGLIEHIELVNQSAMKGKDTAISPLTFVEHLRQISKNTMRVGRQHDAHEFLRALIDSMNSSCALAAGETDAHHNRNLETSAINQIFGGYLESRLTCLGEECGGISNSFEPFLDLSLNISLGQVKSIKDALDWYFAKEVLDEQNLWDCAHCGKKQRVAKQTLLRKGPYQLVLHVKRFGFGTRGNKLNKHIAFESKLDLTPYMVQQGDGCKYALVGMIVHSGLTLNSGHYYSFVKASNGLWYEMDDDDVRQVGLDRVLSQPAYMLFYSRIYETKPERKNTTLPLPQEQAENKPQQNKEDDEEDMGVPVTLPIQSNRDDDDDLENDVSALAAFANQYSIPDEVEHKTALPENLRLDLFGKYLGIPKKRLPPIWNWWRIPNVLPLRLKIRTAKYIQKRHVQHLLALKQRADQEEIVEDETKPREQGEQEKEKVEEEAKPKASILSESTPSLKPNAWKDATEKVIVHKQGSKQGREGWDKFVKESTKSKKRKQMTEKEQWDAMLDLGKQKKVKGEQTNDKIPKQRKGPGNRFQVLQDKKNVAERKRKGWDS